MNGPNHPQSILITTAAITTTQMGAKSARGIFSSNGHGKGNGAAGAGGGGGQEGKDAAMEAGGGEEEEERARRRARAERLEQAMVQLEGTVVRAYVMHACTHDRVCERVARRLADCLLSLSLCLSMIWLPLCRTGRCL